MKKVYRICCIKSMEICVPSTDYYSRREDWQKETVNIISFGKDFETEEEAIEHLKNKEKSYLNKEYTILPFYKSIK